MTKADLIAELTAKVAHLNAENDAMQAINQGLWDALHEAEAENDQWQLKVAELWADIERLNGAMKAPQA